MWRTSSRPPPPPPRGGRQSDMTFPRHSSKLARQPIQPLPVTRSTATVDSPLSLISFITWFCNGLTGPKEPYPSQTKSNAFINDKRAHVQKFPKTFSVSRFEQGFKDPLSQLTKAIPDILKRGAHERACKITIHLANGLVDGSLATRQFLGQSTQTFHICEKGVAMCTCIIVHHSYRDDRQ